MNKPLKPTGCRHAQSELTNRIRFSSKHAANHQDGLTLGSMEIGGVSAWLLRNFTIKKM